jgi:hypothetical protein
MSGSGFTVTPACQAGGSVGTLETAAPGAPSPEIFESKLHRPLVRPAIVPRTELVDRLLDAAHVPVVSIVGPPDTARRPC